MLKPLMYALLATALMPVATVASAQPAPAAQLPAGQGNYAQLVTLFDEFRAWKDAVPVVGEVADSEPWDGVADYGDEAVAERRREMREYLDRIRNMNVASWDRSQQVDWLAVRAQFDQYNFFLNVSKPWERDPGFYVDQMLAVTFVDLPADAETLALTRAQLRAIPTLVAEAKRNLDNVAADYADLALHNLSNADGVGHGHPYREVPPAGVIGWYEDLLGRTSNQPELRGDVQQALAAVRDFQAWLVANRPRMTAQAGVGEENFNWYLKHVKMMPYTAAELVVLGQREAERLWSLYALDRHANRDLPELLPADSAAEYQRRIDATDESIRRFLVEEEFITIPPYIGKLGTNVPWIVRPQGRNFWEEVQYRDPTPDHLHAVIPGHRFDGVVEDHNTHPIRRHITDGVRTEGWGVYLEEGAQRLGLLDDKPRVKELIDIFGIFRAVRVPADVWLQLNQMTIAEAVAYWRERTPYLDANVARVDAEIYLRRPPGYGLGYTIGMIQMQKLLADRRRQLGDEFVLKDFHDQLMAAGRLPFALIRWEMTGMDDEIRGLWSREPLPEN